MKMTPGLASEEESVRAMERHFAAVDAMCGRGEPHDALPGSVLVGDHRKYPHEPMGDWTWRLILTALDHLHMLRRLAGQPPTGLAEWHSTGPWTLVRSSLEMSSQAIWLIAPTSRDVRIERLLRLLHEDFSQAAKAQMCTLTKAQRLVDTKAQAPLVQLQQRAQGLGDWQRISAKLNLLDCIRYAAPHVGAAKPDEAELLWRTASGFAHGRTWSLIGASRLDDRIPSGDRSVRVHLTSDLNKLVLLLGLATATVLRADILLRNRLTPAY